MRPGAQPWNESPPDGQAAARPRANGVVEQFEEEYEGDNPAYASLLGKRKNKPKKTPVLILDAHEATKAAEVMELNAGQLMTNPQRSERITDFQTFDIPEDELEEEIEELDEFVEDDEDELDIPEEYRVRLEPLDEEAAQTAAFEEAPLEEAPLVETPAEDWAEPEPAEFDQSEFEPEQPAQPSAEMRLRQAYGFGGPITPSRSDAERFYDAAPPSVPLPFESVEPDPAAEDPAEADTTEPGFAPAEELEEAAPAHGEHLAEPGIDEFGDQAQPYEAPGEPGQEWSWDEPSHEFTGADEEADDIGWEPDSTAEPAAGWDRPKGKEKLDALGQPLRSLEPDPIEELPGDFDFAAAADASEPFADEYTFQPQTPNAHGVAEEPYPVEPAPCFADEAGYEQAYEGDYGLESERELMPLPTLKLEEPEIPMPRHELRARVVKVHRPHVPLWLRIWKGLVWLYRWAERRWGKPKDEPQVPEKAQPEPSGVMAWLKRIKF
ncbi:MAG TPA: hypothetical protein VLA37_05125 [Sphingomonadaceae bacterium]|nr:hypothetical protein [Sphingomonadaceae bacterium]